MSLPIGPRLLVWPGDPTVEVKPASRIADGDAANVSSLRMSSHTGTHVDPPLHFMDGGAAIDALPLDALVGPADVLDLRGHSSITSEVLKDAGIKLTERVLLKTDNSELWRTMPSKFPDEYVSLTADGARWMVESGVRLVGTDFLGIEARGAKGHPTHMTLLEAGVVIVEGLDLSDVEPGRYQFVCLPLRIAEGDGAPARAILIEE